MPTTESENNGDWIAVDLGDVTGPIKPGNATCNCEDIELTDIVHTEEVKSGLAARPSETNIPQIQFGQNLNLDDGIAVKPSVKHEVRHIRHKVMRHFLYSVLRNGMCWMFVVCTVAVCVGRRNVYEWLHDERVSVLVLLILGLLGVPFQAVHVARELKNKKPSIVACMLRNLRNVTDFKQTVRERQTSPPYLAVEIALKSGAIAHWVQSKTDANEWMQTSRRNIKILDVESWMDRSAPVDGQRWDDLESFWIILSKNYRFMDKNVQTKTQEEASQFKKDCQYDKFMYFMTFQYVLDVQEGDYFPDAEACLVYKSHKSKLYQWITYTVFLSLALDCIYQLMFYSKTKSAEDYYFIKFIDR